MLGSKKKKKRRRGCEEKLWPTNGKRVVGVVGWFRRGAIKQRVVLTVLACRRKEEIEGCIGLCTGFDCSEELFYFGHGCDSMGGGGGGEGEKGDGEDFDETESCTLFVMNEDELLGMVSMLVHSVAIVVGWQKLREIHAYLFLSLDMKGDLVPTALDERTKCVFPLLRALSQMYKAELCGTRIVFTPFPHHILEYRCNVLTL